MALHLSSAFFEERTLRSLVYSAPFVAPLSYVGVGSPESMGDAYTPAPADTAEATHDLQERIGRFARAIFGIATSSPRTSSSPSEPTSLTS